MDAVGVVVFEDVGKDGAESSGPAEVLVGVFEAGAVGGVGVDANFVGVVVEGVGELAVGVFGEGGAGFDVPGAVGFADVFVGFPVEPSVDADVSVGVELDGLPGLLHEGTESVSDFGYFGVVHVVCSRSRLRLRAWFALRLVAS